MSKQIKDYYEFEVKTADQHLAGTDSNIFLILYGELDQSNEVRINKYIHGNAFERNKIDKFKVPLEDIGRDLGRIYRVELRSDCMYANPAWRPNYIHIRRHIGTVDSDLMLNKVSRFDLNEWIKDKKTHIYNLHLSWDDHCKYEVVYEDMTPEPLFVAPHETYHYKKTVTERTGFKVTNTITKENTTSFNAKFGFNNDYSETVKAAEELETVTAFKPFLELGFSHSFSNKEINDNTKEENKEITTTVSYDIKNESSNTMEYEVIYKIKRINALVIFDSLVGEFSLKTQIVFIGIRDVKTKSFIYKA